MATLIQELLSESKALCDQAEALRQETECTVQLILSQLVLAAWIHDVWISLIKAALLNGQRPSGGENVIPIDRAPSKLIRWTSPR